MLFLLIASLVLAGALAFLYKKSPVVAAINQAANAVLALGALRSELATREQETRQAVDRTGSALQSVVRTERLRNLPIDRIKLHASGVRLQALRDAGLRTIEDVRGMSAQRLTNLRGVGPKSASSIASVVENLVHTSNRIPIPLPAPPFDASREWPLLQAVYGELFYTSGLAEEKRALDALHVKAQADLADVRRDCTFVTWLVSFGRSAKLTQARETAENLTHDLERKPEVATLKTQVSAFLMTSRAISNKPAAHERVLGAYRQESQLYDWMLAKALGHANLGAHPSLAKAPSVRDEDLPPREAPTPQPSSGFSMRELPVTLPIPSNPRIAMKHEPQTTPSQPQRAPDETVVPLVETHVEFGRIVAGPPPGETRAWVKPLTEMTAAKNAAEALQQLNRLQAARIARQTVTEPTFEELVAMYVGQPEQIAPDEHPVPPRLPAPSLDRARWIEPGDPVHIQGVTISQAFFFCGPTTNASDRFVVDPSLSAKSAEFSDADNSALWFSYANAAPGTRFRYLQWLSAGAPSPCPSGGFAAVYFQGLERRILQLLRSEETNADDKIGPVLAELRRIEISLRALRDATSYQAQALLNFLGARTLIGAPIPELRSHYERGYELAIEFRLGLGCLIRERLPIPVEWAWQWAQLEPTISLRTAASRCPKEVAAAFRLLYVQKYGAGLVIKPNKTMLSLSYQPTWTGGDNSAVRLDFTGVPDVKALTGPQNALRELVEQATALVDPYSRLLGPAAARAGKLDALLLLPAALWPADAQSRFDAFRQTAVDTMRPITCAAFFAALECSDEVTPHRVTELARNLQRFQIGFEPDVLNGARRPKATDPVVLFPLTGDTPGDVTRSYQAAALSVALAAVLALANGHASSAEADAVSQMIAAWKGLGPDLHSRLRANYVLCLQQPPTLASLKTRLEALQGDERRRLASSLAMLASSDGVVSVEEVKVLERVYQILTIESHALYSDLHGGTSAGFRVKGTAASNGNESFLDHSRITALRKESSQVSQLLAAVFLEEEQQKTAIVAPPFSQTAASDSHLGALNAGDRQFLAALLGKSEWPRIELLQLAARMQIMLDGTLERINDAALDQLGEFLLEGDDPIYVQQTLLETAE